MTSTSKAQPERVDGETLYAEYLEIFHEHSQQALVGLARDARRRMAPPPRSDFEVVTTPSLSLLPSRQYLAAHRGSRGFGFDRLHVRSTASD